MKSITLFPVILALASLSACGLRGDLETPGPMVGEPPEDAPPPAELEELSQNDLRPRNEIDREPGTSYRDPDTGRTVWVQNEGGGLKPLPSPTTSLEESSLPPLQE
ncbi:MAG: hypothetical protein CMK09_10130 [Ponticaulis sp.]|nr:hypothetical protein [Ponticaulis sp.]|tara:strand:- start:42017 stop:42334 length:318 start_codon:yes stop_codon:yes gene_type:complete